VTGVLAAVDLSSMGRRVAERARLVAETRGSDLTLIHVLEPMAETFIPDEVADLLRRHRHEALGEMAAWVRSRTDRPVSIVDTKGSPVWEIGRAAKQAEITVMGTSTVDQARVGPVAVRLAETLRGDALVVRRQPRAQYRKVVVAVDLSEASARAVALAAALAPDGELTLVFVLSTRFEGYMSGAGMYREEIDSSRRHRMVGAKEALARFASRWDGVGSMVADGPTIETIDEQIRRLGADLVVASSRGAGATKVSLLGTVTAGLMDSAPCDVGIARVPGEFRRP
jgi:nucleotide-binding universal stress UspA family protein